MDLVKLSENNYINVDNINRVFIEEVDGTPVLFIDIGMERVAIPDASRRDFLFNLFKNSRSNKQYFAG